MPEVPCIYSSALCPTALADKEAAEDSVCSSYVWLRWRMHASAFSAGLGLAVEALHAARGRYACPWTSVKLPSPAVCLKLAWQPLCWCTDFHPVTPLPAGGAAHFTKDALWQHEKALHAGAMPMPPLTGPPEADPDDLSGYIHKTTACVR